MQDSLTAKCSKNAQQCHVLTLKCAALTFISLNHILLKFNIHISVLQLLLQFPSPNLPIQGEKIKYNPARIYLKYMLNMCCKQWSSIKYIFEIKNIFTFQPSYTKMYLKNKFQGQIYYFQSYSSLRLGFIHLFLFKCVLCSNMLQTTNKVFFFLFSWTEIYIGQNIIFKSLKNNNIHIFSFKNIKKYIFVKHIYMCVNV